MTEVHAIISKNGKPLTVGDAEILFKNEWGLSPYIPAGNRTLDNPYYVAAFLSIMLKKGMIDSFKLAEIPPPVPVDPETPPDAVF